MQVTAYYEATLKKGKCCLKKYSWGWQDWKCSRPVSCKSPSPGHRAGFWDLLKYFQPDRSSGSSGFEMPFLL